MQKLLNLPLAALLYGISLITLVTASLSAVSVQIEDLGPEVELYIYR